jgi:hypothetical protein
VYAIPPGAGGSADMSTRCQQGTTPNPYPLLHGGGVSVSYHRGGARPIVECRGPLTAMTANRLIVDLGEVFCSSYPWSTTLFHVTARLRPPHISSRNEINYPLGDDSEVLLCNDANFGGFVVPFRLLSPLSRSNYFSVQSWSKPLLTSFPGERDTFVHPAPDTHQDCDKSGCAPTPRSDGQPC